MFRIWAKVLKENRIQKQFVYESDETFAYSDFFTYLTDICGRLDEPTPILLKTHIFAYAKFRHVTFRKDDFIEHVSFDKLILENIL